MSQLAFALELDPDEVAEGVPWTPESAALVVPAEWGCFERPNDGLFQGQGRFSEALALARVAGLVEVRHHWRLPDGEVVVLSDEEYTEQRNTWDIVKNRNRRGRVEWLNRQDPGCCWCEWRRK